MEEALVARLRATGDVASIAGTRISWFERPRRAGFPCVVLTQISPGREWTHGGPDGLDRPRIRFDCWAETDTAAVALGRAVQAEMEQPRTVAGWVFHEGQIETRRSDVDDMEGGRKAFRILLEFTFFHQPQE
jgi:hypothetical protein